jgi:transposase
MLSFEGKDIYLVCGASDMRKGLGALSLRAMDSLGVDAFSGAVFVFSGKSHKTLKALEWDGEDFWMHMRKARRFKWPKENGGDAGHPKLKKVKWEELKELYRDESQPDKPYIWY